MIIVGIYGSNGYVGEELVELFSTRESIEIVCPSARKKEIPDKLDFAFLCLPEIESMTMAPLLLARGIRVFDLSGAFRLQDTDDYEKYYHFTHLHPELLAEAVYALPELTRDGLKGARLFALAGCYPTGIILGLDPLIVQMPLVLTAIL